MATNADESDSALPRFLAPPVSEVIIAVEFASLPGLDILKLVDLHRVWADDFPRIELQPAIPPPLAGGLSLGFVGGTPPMRLWSLTGEGDVLLQVQADRLIVNWRRPASEVDAYPSYGSLISTWEKAWAQFCEYATASNLGNIDVSIIEVSYVNLIEVSSVEAVVQNFRLLAQPVAVGVVEQVASRTASRVEGAGGSGHVVVQAEFPAGDNSQLSLSIVTRLAGPSPETARALRERLDVAHAAGVRTFAALASDEMHRSWGAL